ncbi:hypothetical protein AB835_14625 [Candidatus Endobugula sertula]|uniref:Winged helix-turn helix domain-containing protein n=1 Tax=Candidatus Endobugula sertula TaxID=62101 RepID=A0A1D2QLC1_9GAMM|nr:hypothetical protein AB835_14625 [Candidatus Endobugula sertula]
MDYSRDRVYRFKERYDKGGETTLLDTCQKQQPMVKNHVPEHIEQAVRQMTIDQPTFVDIYIQ